MHNIIYNITIYLYYRFNIQKNKKVDFAIVITGHTLNGSNILESLHLHTMSNEAVESCNQTYYLEFQTRLSYDAGILMCDFVVGGGGYSERT